MLKYFLQHEHKIDTLFHVATGGIIIYAVSFAGFITSLGAIVAMIMLASFNYYHGYLRGLRRSEEEADLYFTSAKEALLQAQEFKRAARDMLDATRREAQNSLTNQGD